MSKDTQIILQCAALALGSLLVFNLIAFLVTLLRTNMQTSWDFRYKLATFYVNNEPVGLPWGEGKTFLFVILMFVWLLSRQYRKGNLE